MPKPSEVLIWINDDGSARELSEPDKKYVDTEFSPWTRLSAISRAHSSRWASKADQVAKLRPAMAFFLTYPTPRSSFPFVRARYGAQARGRKPQCLAKARRRALNSISRVNRS